MKNDFPILYYINILLSYYLIIKIYIIYYFTVVLVFIYQYLIYEDLIFFDLNLIKFIYIIIVL